jgi:hypothetical protein
MKGERAAGKHSNRNLQPAPRETRQAVKRKTNQPDSPAGRAPATRLAAPPLLFLRLVVFAALCLPETITGTSSTLQHGRTLPLLARALPGIGGRVHHDDWSSPGGCTLTRVAPGRPCFLPAWAGPTPRLRSGMRAHACAQGHGSAGEGDGAARPKAQRRKIAWQPRPATRESDKDRAAWRARTQGQAPGGHQRGRPSEDQVQLNKRLTRCDSPEAVIVQVRRVERSRATRASRQSFVLHSTHLPIRDRLGITLAWL